MIRNIIYTIIFAILGLMIMAQTDQTGHALMESYHGLWWTQCACWFLFGWNICAFIIRLVHETGYDSERY